MPPAAAERRATPAAVRRVPAALHHGRAPVRGQMLQHDAQSLAKRRHPAEAVGNLGVDPQAVRQPAEGELALSFISSPAGRPPPSLRTRIAQGLASMPAAAPGVDSTAKTVSTPTPTGRACRAPARSAGSGSGQHERGVPHHLHGQAEHPPRGSGDLALGNVENT